MEIKHFQNKNSYDKISMENTGILYYTERILPSQIFDIHGAIIKMTKTSCSKKASS